MAEAKHEGHLGAVYEAQAPEDIARIYDAWSESYEADMAAAGYRHPSVCLALMSRYLPKGAGPLLDAGAGTGLIGEWLGILGYGPIEGLDLSQGMLAVAARKGVYAQLHNLALGGPLPFADGHFAGVISAGVFTTGHVGPKGLDELVRICRKGGVIVLTVKTTLWDAGFAPYVERMVVSGRVEVAEATAPYVSMPGEVGTVPSLGLVLRVL